MINNTLTKDIRGALESISLFEADDFVISSNEDLRKTTLCIKYMYSDNYHFNSFINRDTTAGIKISMSPGDFLDEEERTVVDRRELIGCISEWTKK